MTLTIVIFYPLNSTKTVYVDLLCFFCEKINSNVMIYQNIVYN